jgi:hypothetical protein
MSPGFRTAWAGILLIGAIAVALIVREARQSESRAVALSLATQRQEQARQRVTLAEQKRARAERESAAHRAEATPGAGAPAASTGDAATAGTKERAAKGAGVDKLARRDGKIRPEVAEATDPVLRALSLQMFDANFEWVWGPVLQQLALSPEKAAALQALLRAHEERRMDVTAVAGEQGLELKDPAIQKMRSADGARLAQEVLALLGPDDANVYQQFRRELGVMAQVNGIAEATFHTSTPLTYAESLQMRSILAAHSEREANGFVRPNSINGEAALAQIVGSGAFSAATVGAFRQQVADAQMHRQISQRLDEIGTKIMGPGQSELWVPRFPALRPRPQP